MKAAFAILVLLITTTLSVYKPWGFTPYGLRLHQKRRMMQGSTEVAIPTALVDAAFTPIGSQRKRLALFLGLSSALIIALVLMHHLLGHGFRDHGF